jgi:hypothetical protein
MANSRVRIVNGATEITMKIYLNVWKTFFTNTLLIIHKNNLWPHDQLRLRTVNFTSTGECINSEIKARSLIIN